MDENMKTKSSREIRKKILLSSGELCIGPFSPRMIFLLDLCQKMGLKREEKQGEAELWSIPLLS